MKVVAYNNQYRITIPKELAEERGWKPGTRLKFIEDLTGNIMIKEVKIGGKKEAKK